MHRYAASTFVLDDVRQRRLDHLAGMVRFVGGPIPERRPEAVRDGRDLLLLEQLAQLPVGERLPALPREDQRAGPIVQRPRPFEKLQRPARVGLAANRGVYGWLRLDADQPLRSRRAFRAGSATNSLLISPFDSRGFGRPTTDP